ncbi:hypothetical protein OROHE_015866 [Orobanche hederae]
MSSIQIAAPSTSFASFDRSSTSFKSVNALDLPEVGSGPEHCAKFCLDKSSSLSSPPQSLVSMTFDELDLFSSPFAPNNGTSAPQLDSNTQLLHSSLAHSVNVVQDNSSSFPSIPIDEFHLFSKSFTHQNVTSIPPSGGNTQLPSSLAQSVNVVQQFSISSVPKLAGQQPSQTSQPSPMDFFSGPPQDNGGWATFDMPQNMVPVGPEKSAPVVVASSDGNDLGSFNPFSVDEKTPYITSSSHEPSALSTRAFGHESLQNSEATRNQTHSWSAFGDPAGGRPIHDVIHSDKQASDADNSLGFGVYEAFNNDGNTRTTNEGEPSSSILSKNADVHSFATEHKPTNPFDLPYDSEMESSNAFWNMSSLQAALPQTQVAPSYTLNQSWEFQNSVSSYAPAGVPFGPSTDSLGFMAGQASSTQVPNIHAQGPVGSVGGNPFA